MTESLSDFQTRALSEFTLRHKNHEVMDHVEGELKEASIFDISYWYGNRELTASNDKFSATWSLDSMNGVKWYYEIIEESEENY